MLVQGFVLKITHIISWHTLCGTPCRTRQNGGLCWGCHAL